MNGESTARVAAACVALLGCGTQGTPPPSKADAAPECMAAINACGGCGTACDSGGTCRSGSCDLPVTIATAQHDPWNIARDEGYVYWTSYAATNGKVSRAAREGAGANPTQLATAQRGAWGIAVDAGDVFWTNSDDRDGTVMKLAATGGGAIELAGGIDRPQAIALDATNVYVASIGSGSVLRIPRDGGEKAVIATGLGTPEGLAVDALRLVVTDSLGGRVLAVPLDGGEPVVLAEAQSGPSAVAIDAEMAYFTTRGVGGEGGVAKVPLDASEPPTLLSSGFAPSGIALDEANVYFSDEAIEPEQGIVASVPKTGGVVTIIAGNQDEPWSIAVDDSTVYWTNVRGGTVLSTTK